MARPQFISQHPRTTSIVVVVTALILIIVAIAVTVTQANKERNDAYGDTTLVPTASPGAQDTNPQRPSPSATPSRFLSVSVSPIFSFTSLPSSSTTAMEISSGPTRTPVVVGKTPIAASMTPAVITSTPTPATKTPGVITESSITPSTSLLFKPEETPSQVPLPTVNNSECSQYAQCSFFDNFNFINNLRWTPTDHTANGGAFGSWWDKSKVVLTPGGLRLYLDLSPALEKQYASGQLQSNGWFEYGCFEASIKPASKSGLVTGFFLYTGEYDSAPGAPTIHNEIDFEFVWRTPLKRTIVQTNYFTNGRKEQKKDIFQKFDVDEQFHTYSMKWTPTSITWYIDGISVRHVNDGSTPFLRKSGPMKMFLNLWPINRKNINASNWGGKYVHDYEAPLPESMFQWVRYSKGQDCKIASI